MAANIVSYRKLQEIHSVHYNETTDIFSAVPLFLGPVLHFHCVQGHYIMDLDTILHAYVATISPTASRYGKRQYEGAKRAYDFIVRMGSCPTKQPPKLSSEAVSRTSGLADQIWSMRKISMGLRQLTSWVKAFSTKLTSVNTTQYRFTSLSIRSFKWTCSFSLGKFFSSAYQSCLNLFSLHISVQA